MIVFKSCPHCHGDLYIARDQEPVCLQCGYELRPSELETLLTAANAYSAPSPQSDAVSAGRGSP
jgi:hypothetical protein